MTVSSAVSLLVALGFTVLFCFQLAYLGYNLNCGCALFGNPLTIALLTFAALCLAYSLTYVVKYGRIALVGPELRYVEA